MFRHMSVFSPVVVHFLSGFEYYFFFFCHHFPPNILWTVPLPRHAWKSENHSNTVKERRQNRSTNIHNKPIHNSTELRLMTKPTLIFFAKLSKVLDRQRIQYLERNSNMLWPHFKTRSGWPSSMVLWSSTAAYSMKCTLRLDFSTLTNTRKKTNMN